jgi:hypothetical protein
MVVVPGVIIEHIGFYYIQEGKHETINPCDDMPCRLVGQWLLLRSYY